ncbi:hypothetical protein K488DRAFT_51614 [Vararia minispora EC-137]|uniref:Uncharacterized protein n=1 Tax=Vararia minispora EC-137 TaxID=1314806 RepID=A0ACB8QJ27_9AGAM|nr:hypothetical protein K488DRAFT_51614 [Vararia minispora EC-137]
MATRSSRRSDLIDVTYKQIHEVLVGIDRSVNFQELDKYLGHRLPAIQNAFKPFGKPNEESRRKILSGSVTLQDNVKVDVDEDLRLVVFTISHHFDIDEVDAFILLRSYIYNEGLGSEVENTPRFVTEFAEFFYQERRHLARIHISLHSSAQEDRSGSILRDIGSKYLPLIKPDERAYFCGLVAEYTAKTKAPVPDCHANDPRLASAWAKENLKDQLVMLEVLFWGMMAILSRQGRILLAIFEAAYATQLGSLQHNSMLLLDTEGSRLIEDCASTWLLVMICSLQFENDGVLDLTGPPSDDGHFTSSPDVLTKLHQLFISHGDSQYVPVCVAWALVLSHLELAVRRLDECPAPYRAFFDSLDPRTPRTYSKNAEPTAQFILTRCLDPGAGFLRTLLSLLTETPLFVTTIYMGVDSALTMPNTAYHRLVIKELLVNLMDVIKVDLIPEFDTFVDVWVALFGRAESDIVTPLAHQFWQCDFDNPARRAILDATRARFPVQFGPFVRVLRALSGSGFSRSDPLAPFTDLPQDTEPRMSCSAHVARYFDALPTFTQVVPLSAVSGSHALYERIPERYGSSSSTTLAYVNLRPVTLPGGSMLPLRSHGVLMSPDGEEFILVNWRHEHSGWRLLLDVLTDYNRRRRLLPAVSSTLANLPLRGRVNAEPITLELSDIGMEVREEGDPTLVADALDLLGAVGENPVIREDVMDSVQPDSTVVGRPGIAEQTMLVLEDALSLTAAQLREPPKTALIASCLNTLTVLLSTRRLDKHVWLITRASPAFFESSRNLASAATILAADRATGTYSTTHALLMFVQEMYWQAVRETLVPGQTKMHQVRVEVLLRALHFVHADIWVEHSGWKYLRLGDRFRVGGAIASLYGDILEQNSPGKDGPLGALSQAVYDALVVKATAASIGPLITTLAAFPAVQRRRLHLDDVRAVYFLLQSHLRVLRLCLTLKQKLHSDQGTCLLEQVLCTRAALNAPFSGRRQDTPLDVLVGVVQDNIGDSAVRLDAVRVLSALCASLALSHPNAPTILGHLSDPEGAADALVRRGRDPYVDGDLRIAIWRFLALAVEREPALGDIFVTGRLRTAMDNGGSNDKGDQQTVRSHRRKTALETVRELMDTWKSLWEVNQELLTSLLGFVCAVWGRGSEHRAAIDVLRKDDAFWDHIVGIIREDLPPLPDYRSEEYTDDSNMPGRSSLHIGVAAHADLILSKAFAIRIVAFDIALDRHTTKPGAAPQKPRSYLVLEPVFKAEDQLRDHLSDAVASAYDPAVYDSFSDLVRMEFPGLVLDRLESTLLPSDRSFGDAFAFSTETLRIWTDCFRDPGRDLARGVDVLLHAVFSINLNLSLTHASRELGSSWRALLAGVIPFMQGAAASRQMMLSIAATISSVVASEERPGDLMAAVHDIRLSVLLAVLELVWFSSSETKAGLASFIAVLDCMRRTITSEAQPPLRSIRGFIKMRFHRTLLQVVYFCVCQSRRVLSSKDITSSDRLSIAALVDTTQVFVIDALRFMFDAASERLDTELDADMDLLVAILHESTRPEVSPSSTLWLARCGEASVIRASLDLFVRTDLTGMSKLAFSRRNQPLYAPHILAFHTTLASQISSAERLASEGILVAYARANTGPGGTGLIDVTLPDLPGERNPAHAAYCTMLGVATAVLSALGAQKHYFADEVRGFVRLHSGQLKRALDWTSNESLLTLAFLDELERVADLFYALAQSRSADAALLGAFARASLFLLQHLNYALAHPNQLAGALEPITADERAALEREASDGSGLDPVRRPFLARVVHRLYGLVGTLICTLIVVSRAEDILRAEAVDLPEDCVLVEPQAKAVLGEPASIGTLIEVASSASDILSQLSSRPATQALAPPSSNGSTGTPLDVRSAARTVRRTLESVLFFGAAQLALHLGGEDVGRRGMAADMASEVKAAIERARGVLSKGPDGEKGPDVLEVLVRVLGGRVKAAE